MSDATSPPPNKDHDGAAPEKQGGGPLRIVLFIILLVMFGLLGLDLYARSASNAAFDKVEALVVEKKHASPEEIHELLGREPDAPIEQIDHYYIETYSWQRGNLLKREYVKVIYGAPDDKPVLHEVVRNIEPEANDIPNPPPPELDPENVDPNDGVSPEGSEFTDGAEPTDGTEPTDIMDPADDVAPEDDSDPADGAPPSDRSENGSDDDSADATEPDANE